MQMKFPGKTKQPNLEEKIVFSSCLIGDRAKSGDELKLFTTPIGQYMPMLPRDANLCSKCNQPAGRFLTDADTNIVQAGQLGTAIGDAKFEQITAELCGGGKALGLDAIAELRVAGRTITSVSLMKLIEGWVQIEDEMVFSDRYGERMPTPDGMPNKVPFCLVARTDTVEVRLKLNRETHVEGDAILVKVSIKGKFITARDLAATEPEPD
jgi:hypothetical protein